MFSLHVAEICISVYERCKGFLQQNTDEHVGTRISTAPDETCVAMETT